MTRRRGPAAATAAPRAKRCARSTAPTRTTPATPPPGSYPRHAGASAPLYPGMSRDSSTHMGCRPYPPRAKTTTFDPRTPLAAIRHKTHAPPRLSCLEGCAAVPAGDERTAKPVRERPASRRGSPCPKFSRPRKSPSSYKINPASVGDRRNSTMS